MQVLLIGAGRYGNGLVGRKYKNGEFGVELAGVVDPKIDEIKKSPTYQLKDIPTYHNLKEVPNSCIQDSVSEIAIVPQIVPKSYKELAKYGSRKIILPKPVAANERDFEEILNLSESANIDTAVASNWHYSNITKMTKALLNKLTDKPIDNNTNLPDDFYAKLNGLSGGYKIDRVEVEYNKKFETLAIDPPMQELPHALQIVYSTGCTDLGNDNIIMDSNLQTASRVNVLLENQKVKNGIKLNSDLQMKDRINKKRERLLKIYLEKNGEKVIVTTDYDADFTPNGICIKRPSIKYESLDSPESDWKYEIDEDNINTMYAEIFSYMRGQPNNALSINRYNPIAKTLCQVEKVWKAQI